MQLSSSSLALCCEGDGTAVGDGADAAPVSAAAAAAWPHAEQSDRRTPAARGALAAITIDYEYSYEYVNVRYSKEKEIVNRTPMTTFNFMFGEEQFASQPPLVDVRSQEGIESVESDATPASFDYDLSSSGGSGSPTSTFSPSQGSRKACMTIVTTDAAAAAAAAAAAICAADETKGVPETPPPSPPQPHQHVFTTAADLVALRTALRTAAIILTPVRNASIRIPETPPSSIVSGRESGGRAAAAEHGAGVAPASSQGVAGP